MTDIPINKLTQTDEVIDATLIAAEDFVKGYTFAGNIAPNGIPLTESVNVFYFASQSGTYINLGNLNITEPGFIYYNTVTGYSNVPFSFSGSGISGVTSVNSKTGTVSLTTDDIPEGSINKYFNGTIPTDISDLTDNSNLISSKASKSNVLLKGNVTPFTPNLDYDPSTKLYTDTLFAQSLTKQVYDSDGDGIVDVATLAKNVDWNTANLPNIPLPDSIDNHVNNSTIHFTENSIDKYTKAEVNDLLDVININISDINYTISNLDSASEDLVMSHIYNSSVHFTKSDAVTFFLENITVDQIGEVVLDNTIGNRIYAENNFIVNSETITASLDKLYIGLQSHIDNSDIHTPFSTISVKCSGSEIL